jgi:hypothetical protein
VDELIRADHDTDVRGSTAHRVEEDQVAGLYIAQPYFLTGSVLLAGLARQHHAALREHPLDQPAAIKSGWIAPAVPVGDAAQLHGCLDDR